MKFIQRCGIAATVLLLAACGQAPVRTTGQADAVSPVAQEEKALPPVVDKPSEAQIMAQPTVMKRPVIQDGDRWYLGWDSATEAALTT